MAVREGTLYVTSGSRWTLDVRREWRSEYGDNRISLRMMEGSELAMRLAASLMLVAMIVLQGCRVGKLVLQKRGSTTEAIS